MVRAVFDLHSRRCRTAIFKHAISESEDTTGSEIWRSTKNTVFQDLWPTLVNAKFWYKSVDPKFDFFDIIARAEFAMALLRDTPAHGPRDT